MSHAPDTRAAEEPDQLDGHVAETVDAIAEVHREHYREASWLQRASDAFVGVIGRPGVILGFFAAVLAWIGINLWLARAGAAAADPPPFAALELFATLAALAMGMLILATQRREDVLAEKRSQLTLELALLNETKSAKIISLLEELRRDSPALDDRVDPESDAMSTPTDPQSVLAAIQDRAAADDARKDETK